MDACPTASWGGRSPPRRWTGFTSDRCSCQRPCAWCCPPQLPQPFPETLDRGSSTEAAPCGPSCSAEMLLGAIFFLGTSSLASWLFISNDRLTFPGASPQVPKHVLAAPIAAAGRGCPRLSTGCESQEAFSGGFAEAGDLGTVTEGFVVSISLAAPASEAGGVWNLFLVLSGTTRGERRSCGGEGLLRWAPSPARWQSPG